MIVINENWLVIGIICAIFLYLLISGKREGFQSSTSKNGNTDIKSQICTILNDTYNAVKFNYDSMDKANITNKGVVGVHLEGIQKQIVAQGC